MDENGNLLVVYHGDIYTEDLKFKPNILYFNPEYAAVYHTLSASKGGFTVNMTLQQIL